MPELPEVETMVRDLAPSLADARIAVAVLDLPRLLVAAPPGGIALLAGARIRTVTRRAKRVCILAEPPAAGPLLLAIGPGMSGAFRVTGAGVPPARHDHLRLRLDDGRELRLNDPRTFARIGLYPVVDGAPRDAAGRDPFARLGPEPRAGTPRADLVAALRARGGRRAVKAALLDQEVLAGVGNIYADEALHAARIFPTTPVAALTDAQLHDLAGALVAVIEQAIAARGSTVRTYRAPGGAGSMQHALAAYGRAGLPCGRCGTPLVRLRVAGRGTTACAACSASAAIG